MGIMADVASVARAGVQETRELVSSPNARRARTVLATGLIAAAPIIARHPYVRGLKLMRLVGVAGGAVVIVKLAEAIRDWEPDSISGGGR